MSDSRDAAARLATRLRGLDALAIGRYEQNVRAALQRTWDEGRVYPETVDVRWQLVRRKRPWQGAPSDSLLPPKPERPPLARIISPRGVAVRLYLTCLFVAHCTARRGVEYRNTLPLAPPYSSELGWSELVASATTQSPGTSQRQLSPRDKRVRQLKSALRSLADDDVRLVGLHPPPRPYEWFTVNHEGSSSGMADDVPYTVPRKNEATFAVPLSFFLNGWQHALTDSEILAYLALHDLRLQDRPGHDAHGVHLDGDRRIRYYGMSYDTWEAARRLVAFGLAEREVPPERRTDGTYEGYSAGERPMPDRYRLLDGGTSRAAIEAVGEALGG